MLYLNERKIELHYPLQSFARAELQGLKLPSLFKPDVLKRRHVYAWLYIGLLAEYPDFSMQQVRKNFRKYSVDQLLEAVYTALNVDLKEADSLVKLAKYMEEVQ